MVERITSRRPALVEPIQAVVIRSGSPSASGSEMVRQKVPAMFPAAAEMGRSTDADGDELVRRLLPQLLSTGGLTKPSS
jgi:hypothetical protein